ncbi:MAG: hypothetical protein A2W05_05375 [Candidatus Schekmanbacteria bacterium RBG_16_38_10]|uniref:Methyltransferase type 11 domain-containing protein n=1 Tax=Candidatus Schekmanbacteria bacterium RBG_16_38_10 TaxID=1817879 RepID=A0A1F7S0L6_9BACT|nr:MAG: hypothetical protein A2W05_05375 [Candidatus Schekmanbacteria bacterium RBG_16_38_10]
MYTKKDVVNSNIELHTSLADKYKEEPHYRPENITKIREIIKMLKSKTGGESLLDVGCGMGFIIDIAKEYFKVIRGIDVTPAMLEKVDVEISQCDVKVEIADADNLPFEGNFFDVCTAYAFLHHLHDIQPVLKEIYRVLKRGGIFYSGLDPNNYFWDAIKNLPQNKSYSDIVVREINAVLHKDDELEQQFKIKKEVLRTAEHLKHIEGGFTEDNLIENLKSVGFSDIVIKYDWFLGEGKYIHHDNKTADIIRSYLEETLPLSSHLFKYISIYAVK